MLKKLLLSSRVLRLTCGKKFNDVGEDTGVKIRSIFSDYFFSSWKHKGIKDSRNTSNVFICFLQ